MRIKHSHLILAFLFALVLHATAITRYVDLNSPSPTPPYTSWPTAATNIQDAIDVATAGEFILVTNGIYATGGRVGYIPTYGVLTNRVALTKAVTVQSVNGPTVTIIEGFQLSGTTNGNGAIRCAFLTNGATLTGFTLTNGATGTNVSEFDGFGGGLFCMPGSPGSPLTVISNCIITGNVASKGGGGVYVSSASVLRKVALNNCAIIGNSASLLGGGLYSDQVGSAILNNCVVAANSAPNEGGAYRCNFNNCLISRNSAIYSGGGVGYCILNNCTLLGNSAGNFGGGSTYSTATNSIIYYNNAPSAPNFYSPGSPPTIAYYCCSAPLPLYGIANITNAPQFVDLAGGDFHLQSNSSCINAGNNTYVSRNADLDGSPRIVGGAVDIGAYEFQSPSSVLSYAWAQQNGLPTDGSADFTDADGDGMNNYGEWRADTIPTNAISVLRMVNATNSPAGANVTWQSVATRNYWLERATNLGVATPFQIITTNLAGVAGTQIFTDTTATNVGPYFYRVGVQ